MDYANEIWAYALKNAFEFGKSEPSKILPKLFQHGLDRKDIKKVMSLVEEICKKVNSMKKEDLNKELEKYKKYAKEKEEKEDGLPPLENATEGKVITRLAPEPSKYNHIGHALVFMIQYLYAKKYNGKCILRFDDTNPEKSTKEYYDAMKNDLGWLGIKWDKEEIASDKMSEMYRYAEKLIKDENAFVCDCSQEDMRSLREKMKECKCRKKTQKKNIEEWDKMLSGKYKEGEVTLRLKGDMKSNNGVMRDPVIFRLSYAKHFIQGDKYKVWPMYDFENPVLDATSGVSHVIRSNEFELRAELHELILKLLGLKAPIFREIGRYQISGAETQGRVIREMIEKKEINGWDDPRLVTVSAMRRRGFTAEMFQEIAQTVGLSKAGGKIDPSVLSAVNRKIIDKTANRYSFVREPVEVKVDNSPEIKEIEVLLHPDKELKRKVKVTNDHIFISKSDFDELKGKEIRLLHLYNIKLDKKATKGKTKAEFTSSEVKAIPKINWVSFGLKVKVLMDDGKWIEGTCDEGIWDLKPGTIVQFERNFFARLDKIEKNTYEFWFTHK